MLPFLLRAAGSLAGSKAMSGALSKKEKKSSAKSINNAIGLAGSLASSKIKEDSDDHQSSYANVPNVEPVKPSVSDKDSVKTVLDIAVNYLSSISETIKSQLDFDRQQARDEYLESKENDIERITSPIDNEDDAVLVEDDNEEDGIISTLISFITPLVATITAIGAAIAGIIGLSSGSEASTEDAAPAPRQSKPRASAEPVTRSPTTGSNKQSSNKQLSLSNKDIIDIKKTVETEWSKNAGDEQAYGIIDTILNRTASGKWGNSVSSVVNARNQFSDINGPISRRKGRSSVDQIPASRISSKTSRIVDEYLARRASGEKSSVDDHLNYANPHHSDEKNLEWINRLKGPVLGKGKNIHRHGTTKSLQRHRPGDFSVKIPQSSSRRVSSRSNKSNSLYSFSSNETGRVESNNYQPRAEKIGQDKINSELTMLARLMSKPKPIENQTPTERLKSVNGGSLDIINPNYRSADSTIVSSYIKSFNVNGNMVA